MSNYKGEDQCLCCGASAVNLKNQNKFNNVWGSTDFTLSDADVRFICKHCDKHHSYACALNFIDRALTPAKKKNRSVPYYILKEDPWFKAIHPYYELDKAGKDPPESHIYIDNCISCGLLARIPDDTQRSITQLPLPPSSSSIYSNVAEPDDSNNNNENTIDTVTTAIASVSIDNCSSLRKRKRKTDLLLNQYKSLPSSDSDNMKYLQGYRTIHTPPYNYSKIAKNYGKQNKRLECQFVGAVYFPSHNLLVTSYTDINNLFVDIHALAKSLFDGTEAIPHMVIHPDDAHELDKFFRSTNNTIKPRFLKPNQFEFITVEGVEMPQDASITRSWDVARIVLPQQQKLDSLDSKKGDTRVSIEDLSKCDILSNKHLPKADQVIICGDLSLEDEDNSKADKLLCSRIQSLLTPNISEEDAVSLYSTLCHVAGKGGWEMNRTSGTNACVNDSTHKDLTLVLHTNQSLLPNKAGACWIIPHKKFYYILYSKHNPGDNKHPIACTTYSPPKPGGSFLLNSNAISKWPILGEFAFVKMIATLTLKKLNEYNVAKRQHTVASGPIVDELRNINYARRIFNQTWDWVSFIKAFITVNSMSLIAWPVGLHNDHFNEGGESLENKILFNLPSKKISGAGRGGSILKDQFVFALLDWQHISRSSRAFFNAHHAQMGIPYQASNAQTILTQFFYTHPTGLQWQQQYDVYVNEGEQGTV